MIRLETDAKETEGLALVKEAIEPEIARFEKRFQSLSNSRLTGMEREVLKAYLYQKLTKQL